ncbi:MAG: PAS domain-containing protein [Magnetococcales bacterium]|nr:PAS domain-containing protein [Magnetococcales bacterium]
MKIGIRGKLFLISLLLDAALLFQVGFTLESTFRTRLEKSIETRLMETTRLLQVFLEADIRRVTISEIDKLSDVIGETAHERITIIDKYGRVLGDSRLSTSEVQSVENHLDRPEVQAAFKENKGLSRRYSNTLNVEMLYASRMITISGEPVVLRIAKSLAEIERAIADQRRILIIALFLSFLLAALFTALAMEYITRNFRKLVDRAATMTQGLSGQLIPIQTGDEIGGLAQSFNDLAEKLETTVMELANDRSRMGAVLEGMSEGVLALDRDQRISLVNHTAAEMLDITSDTIGKPLKEAVPVTELAKLVEENTPDQNCSTEFDILTPSRRCLQIIGTYTQANGGCVLVLRDVTEVRLVERTQRDFVANVSHELRTPVHIILINAELLQDLHSEKNPAETELLEALERNARRLSRIIEHLLYLSRIEADQQSLAVKRISLLAAVHHTLSLLKKVANEKGITIGCTVESELELHTDFEALSEVVLFNLLDNAIKYSPQGSRITIRTRKVGRESRLEVEDNGPGIPPEHQHKIFDRFFRVDVSRSRTLGGAGLGLAIVKQVVERMGGRIGMEPILPHGCLFWATLPGLRKGDGE